MKRILVPIGISNNATKTLAYAVDLAADFGATVYVADAYPTTPAPATSMANVKGILAEKSFNRLREIVAQVTDKGVPIQIVQQATSDLLETVKQLHKKIGLDLIVVAPLSNNSNEEVFLGPVAGSMIKRTAIPVWVVPSTRTYSPPKKFLLAYKRGTLASANMLAALQQFQSQYQSTVHGLLVKTPGHQAEEGRIAPEIQTISETLTTTVNATIYQGVLEHFQSIAPDVLCVFRRKRGFFEKLWEPDVVLKKDFYCSVPVLVLKNN